MTRSYTTASTQNSPRTWRYTAVGGETTLSGVDGFSVTLSYAVGGEQLFVNGVLLERGVDYTAANGTSITLNNALVVGDLATVISSNTFAISNAIPLSQFTAKGDILVGTGASTETALNVGADGSTLVANSSAGGGVSWAGPSVAAGKNFIINGGFDIWQRGTGSFSAGVYCADRFISGGGGTFTQSTSVVPANFRYSFSITGSGAPQAWISQVIETFNTIPLAGKTIALSAYVAANTSVPLTFYVYYATTVDATYSGGSWTGVTVNNLTNGTPTSTTFNRMTATANIPSNATSLLVQIGTVGSLANTSTYYVSGFQLELGSVATAFSRAGGTLQGELAACQRYFEKSYNQATAPGSTTGSTFVYDLYAGQGRTSTTFKVAKRTTATITLYSPSNGSAGNVDVNGGAVTGNINAPSETGFSTYTSSGYGSAYYISYNWIASAEL